MYWTGDTAKEDAMGYASARAKFGHGEIRVLNNDNSIERVISFETQLIKQSEKNLVDLLSVAIHTPVCVKVKRSLLVVALAVLDSCVRRHEHGSRSPRIVQAIVREQVQFLQVPPQRAAAGKFNVC